MAPRPTSLNFGRVNVFAARNNEVFGARVHTQKTVTVDRCSVTGNEIAIGAHGLASIQVALEDARARNVQLANAIGIGAYDASIVAGQKLQPAIETADHRSRGNEAGSFRHAVAGVQVCFCAQSHAQRLFVQRRTAQKNACVLPDNLVAIVFQQIGQNLIHYRNMRNAETQHVIQHTHGVVALVHDERATAQKRAHHDLEAANVAHGQHHLPHTATFQRQSAVCRGGGTGDAIPRQKRGLRGSRRTRCEHDNARLLAIPRLFAFAGERLELRGMRHRAFRQSGKIGKAVARRIDHQALNRRLLQYVDAGFARGVFQLYDAQLAVAEAVKRQLARKRVAFIIAECGSGKTKIGSTALGALHGLWADQKRKDGRKSFGIVMCPSHVTQKWVREIGETLPDTYGMVVRTIQDLNRLYAMYEKGDKSVFAVFSKEQARDGYMRYPAVRWNRRRRAFLCPDCDGVIEMEISEDGSRYTVPADQFFFQKEHKKNHTCPHCGMPLWSAVNPDKRIDWVKIGEYGWVYRYGAQAHLHRTKNERVLDQLAEIAQNPDAFYPIRGAHRRFPLSTYIKKKLRGRIDGFLCDELHEYNNNSGQGDAMAELYGASRCFVGMTATLINGYSSGIFHLLYRIVPGLMLKDGKRYKSPGDFDAEYGVVENTYEIQDAEYNSNRRTSKRRTKSKQLPGVSPLVFSRFLLEYTAFLSLSDMGKDLPDYEEIPVPLEMPEDVRTAYKEAEHELQKVLRTDRKAAQKILSTYLNLLTVYPDQPYDQAEVVHPINGMPIVTPKNCGDFSRLFPKEERVLELVRQKAANGERVLIYTSWTRTDSQKKLQELLCSEGYRTEILTPQIATDKREDWVNKRVKSGLQVLITNPRCVETGLDLNAFTTIIFYSMGYNLFTLRQASRRSWRINQTAPKVEVYMFYYANTMQAKAMKLMASKLAVAGIIEGTFSEEGLAAMSDVKDLTSQMAKELAAGIRDNVEDIAAAFKKMAIINPNRKKNVQEETNVESSSAPEVVSEPRESSVRTAQAAAIWERYEGLLARTNEEKKKRKSKVAEVDENQLSIFDFAA